MARKKYEWFVVYAVDKQRNSFGSIIMETDTPLFDFNALAKAQDLSTRASGVIISAVDVINIIPFPIKHTGD